MLYAQKLLAELEAKAERFASFQDDFGQRLAAYREALAAMGQRYRSWREIAAVQRDLMAGEPAGAAPTAEYDAWRALRHSGLPVFSFGTRFAHHAEARAWAEGLRGVTTFAVDGSQLLPWREASVPLALVQVGLFENPHQPPAPYVKDAVVELLPPDDLLAGDGAGDEAREPGSARDDERGGRQISPEAIVHLRRYDLEVRTLIARMEHHAAARAAGHAPSDALVVGFLDGSLIVSFATKMPSSEREGYVRAARMLLETSERCRVPLVAYIDTSLARDVLSMLRRLPLTGDAGGDPAPADLPSWRGIYDALLWHGALQWGDRTPAFISARGDLLAGYGEQKDDVAFVYFQAAQDRPPARLELPRWVLDAGLLDRVIDVVRAEVIVGPGYPYPIEAADAVAVIRQADRDQFYGMVQRFAERRGLALTFSRKALSKDRRRV